MQPSRQDHASGCRAAPASPASPSGRPHDGPAADAASRHPRRPRSAPRSAAAEPVRPAPNQAPGSAIVRTRAGIPRPVSRCSVIRASSADVARNPWSTTSASSDPPRDRTQSRVRIANAMLSAPPETATARPGSGSNGPRRSMAHANSAHSSAVSGTPPLCAVAAIPALMSGRSRGNSGRHPAQHVTRRLLFVDRGQRRSQPEAGILRVRPGPSAIVHVIVCHRGLRKLPLPGQCLSQQKLRVIGPRRGPVPQNFPSCGLGCGIIAAGRGRCSPPATPAPESAARSASADAAPRVEPAWSEPAPTAGAPMCQSPTRAKAAVLARLPKASARKVGQPAG